MTQPVHALLSSKEGVKWLKPADAIPHAHLAVALGPSPTLCLAWLQHIDTTVNCHHPAQHACMYPILSFVYLCVAGVCKQLSLLHTWGGP